MPASLRQKLVAVAAPVLAVPLVFVGFIAYMMLDDGCSNTPLASVPSPTDQYIAVIFERSCGATTGFSTQVSLLSKDQPLRNSVGNALVVDWKHGGEGPKVIAEWLGPRELRLSYNQGARVFVSASAAAGVHIQHSRLPQNGS